MVFNYSVEGFGEVNNSKQFGIRFGIVPIGVDEDKSTTPKGGGTRWYNVHGGGRRWDNVGGSGIRRLNKEVEQ